MSRSKVVPMSHDELLSLPGAVGMKDAARALGISLSTAQELAKNGQFPVPVLRLGTAYRVPTGALLDLLHIKRDGAAQAG